MKIAVTAARGFIGQHLCAALAQAGHEVVPLSLRAPMLPDISADVAIHLAHDHAMTQTAPFCSWMEALEQHWRGRVGQQIYLSSCSAWADAQSLYGQSKYRLEQHFLRQGYAVVRPGLVIGPGGIFGRMLGLVRRLPLVPVPGGNSLPVPVVSVEFLCQQLALLPQGEVNVFVPQLAGLTDLLEATARQLKLRRVFVPIPAGLTLNALLLAEFCHLPLPVRAENLLGLLGNRSQIHYSTTGEASLAEAVSHLS